MNPEYERLEKIANRYFSNLSKLSEMMGRSRQFLYSYKNKKGIGRKVILELNEKFNINPRYIQYGEGEMLLGQKDAPESNVAKVEYVENIELPDIRTLTPRQMKKIKEWIKENEPKIDKVLEAMGE